jgi:hypothetical protein
MTTPQPIRPWTPDQLVRADDGSRNARLAAKRACNGCQMRLGDVTEREMLDVARGFELRSVSHECPRCAGLHTLMLTPALRPIGWQAEHGDAIADHRVVCPRREDRDRDCHVWDACGCALPEGFDPLSTQGQEFLEQPCRPSPTGRHTWMPEYAIVACPQAGSCWHADAADAAEIADLVGATAPGVYALDARISDDGAGDWRVVDVAAHRRERPAEVVPVG